MRSTRSTCTNVCFFCASGARTLSSLVHVVIVVHALPFPCVLRGSPSYPFMFTSHIPIPTLLGLPPASVASYSVPSSAHAHASSALPIPSVFASPHLLIVLVLVATVLTLVPASLSVCLVSRSLTYTVSVSCLEMYITL